MPTILKLQQWKIIKNFEGEEATRHPVAACPTKQKSQVVVSFKHGDPKVEETPPELRNSIRIISINIQVLSH